jgi:tetratricopeptide (TPR) repeat protein
MEMGRAAVELQHFPLAEIYFQEALIRNPQDVDAMCDLAALYKRTGRLEYARGLLLRAGMLSPMRAGIAELRVEVERGLFAQLSHVVDSLMTHNHHDAALPRIATLLSIDPQSTAALTAKARCLAATGETDAALSCVDLAIAREPSEELHRLRAEIAGRVEQDRIDKMEESARRLIESGDWVRGEATDVLQAILAQDPSNEWAREQFRRLSDPRAAGATTQPDRSARGALSRVVQEVAPPVASFLDRYLAAILAFFAAWALFRSPLPRALARRLHEPSPFSGDLAHVELAAVLRAVNDEAMTGILALRTPQGRARIYLEAGEPVHCEAFGEVGLDALTNLLREVEQGSFEMRPLTGQFDHTIDRSFDLILADANPEAALAMGIAAARQPRKSRMSELLETKTE